MLRKRSTKPSVLLSMERKRLRAERRTEIPEGIGKTFLDFISKVARSCKFDQRHKRFLSLLMTFCMLTIKTERRKCFFFYLKNAKDKTGSKFLVFTWRHQILEFKAGRPTNFWNSRCVFLFPAAMLVLLRGKPTWRLHTNLYNFCVKHFVK